MASQTKKIPFDPSSDENSYFSSLGTVEYKDLQPTGTCSNPPVLEMEGKVWSSVTEGFLYQVAPKI